VFGKNSKYKGGKFLEKMRNKKANKEKAKAEVPDQDDFNPMAVREIGSQSVENAADEQLFLSLEEELAQTLSTSLEEDATELYVTADEPEIEATQPDSDSTEAAAFRIEVDHPEVAGTQPLPDEPVAVLEEITTLVPVVEPVDGTPSDSPEQHVEQEIDAPVTAVEVSVEGEEHPNSDDEGFPAERANDAALIVADAEPLVSAGEIILPKKVPVLAPEPELKPIFRSDGQLVPNHRLGRYVYERKQISADALDAASREQQVTGKPIGQILVKNGFLTDKQRVEAILAVEESRISQEQVSRSRIPVALHDQYSIIISAEHDETIFVASPYPEDEVATIVGEYYPEKKIEFVSYDPSSMSRFITTMKRSAAVEDIRETKETMLDRIVYKALEMSASDVHVTPQSDSYSVQFRIDGVKRIIRMGPLDEYHTVMAQVKDKATIDLAEKRKPQDGSYQVEYNGKMIDLRVATLPVQNGEHVTIRVLDSDRVHPNLETLGITEVAKWRRGFKQRDGICIIAGATGSGKTTTLNSSLREIDRFGKAIFTVEDPVEYRVPFVNQVSINPSVGLDFAAAVKAFMRNDPDVIILGEVRDAETARNAVKAADTGHLVLITLHTGSIMGAISRMKDLGVEPRELRFMLRAILVQSLVPKLCQSCHGHPDKLYTCKTCNGEKYVGRTVASECEYFESVQDVDRLLNARNDTIAYEERHWTSMAEDAVNKMREGITDVAGLERTFGSQIYPFLTDEEKLQCSNL
jgi:type II secretory ATPase GspE/PulE/Tfp pilus assembly ATPase PilB-like protein